MNQHASIVMDNRSSCRNAVQDVGFISYTGFVILVETSASLQIIGDTIVGTLMGSPSPCIDVWPGSASGL